MNRFFLKIFFINLVSLLFLLVDRCFKWFSITKWATQEIELSFFRLTFSANRYLLWGFKIARTHFYFLIVLAILIVITYLIQAYEKRNYRLILFLSLVILGALSNLADRLIYGYVVDYIDVPWWAVFNLADVGIVIGLFGWLILIISKQSDKQRTMNIEQ